MLGILNMLGDTLRSFGSIHPAIKWGIVAIVGLLAVEFIGKEAVGLWVAVQNAPYQVEQQIAATRQAVAESCSARQAAMAGSERGDDIGKDVPEKRQWKIDCAQYLPDEKTPHEQNAVAKSETTVQIENKLPQIRAQLQALHPDLAGPELEKRATGACVRKYGLEQCGGPQP